MEDWVKDFCNWNNESPVKPVTRKKQSRRRSLRILRRQSVDHTALETPRKPLLDGDDEELPSDSSSESTVDVQGYGEVSSRSEQEKCDNIYGTVWVELGQGYEDIEKPAKKRRGSLYKRNVTLEQVGLNQEESLKPDKENLGEFKSAENRFNDEVDRLWSDLDSLALISSDLPKTKKNTGNKTKPKRRQSFYQKERRRSRILQPIQNIVHSGMSNLPFQASSILKLAANSSENCEQNVDSTSSSIHNLHRERLTSQTGSFSFSPNAVCVVENIFQFSGSDKKGYEDAGDCEDMSKSKEMCFESNSDGQNSDDGQRLVNIVDLGSDFKYGTQSNFSKPEVESDGSGVDHRLTNAGYTANSTVSGAHQRPDNTNSSVYKGFTDHLFGTSDSPELCRSATPESGLIKMQYFMDFQEPVDKKARLDKPLKETDILYEASYCENTPESSFSNKESLSRHFVATIPTMNKTAEFPVCEDNTPCTSNVIDYQQTISTTASTTQILPTQGACTSTGEVLDLAIDDVPQSIEIPSCSTTSEITQYWSPSSGSTCSRSSTPESSPLRNTDTLEEGSYSVPSGADNVVSRLDYYLSKNLIDISPEKSQWIDLSDIPFHIIDGSNSQQSTSSTDKLPSDTQNPNLETEASVCSKTGGLLPVECPQEDKINVDPADNSIIIVKDNYGCSEPFEVDSVREERDSVSLCAKIKPQKLFGSAEDALKENLMIPVLKALPESGKAPSEVLSLLTEPIEIEMKTELKKSPPKPLKPKTSRKRKLAENVSLESEAGGDGFSEFNIESLEGEEDRSSRRSTRLRRKSVEIYRAQTSLIEAYEAESPILSAEETDSPDWTERGRGKKRKGKVRKKKKENIEDIYLNKLYKKPTEKVFSTIFEDPQQDQVFSQRRQRRSITFDMYTVLLSKTRKRTQKATKLGWGPTVRKKHALSKAEFDQKIQALEDELDDLETIDL